MPTLLFQVVTLTTNIVILMFLLYYLIKLYQKEKDIDQKDKKIDTQYHQVVDNALFKERKILEDATDEATHIITGAQYTTQAAREAIRHAMQEMIVQLQKEATDASHNFMGSYQISLQQLSEHSMKDFEDMTKGLGGDLQNQLKQFQSTLLPNLQKELETYKQIRMQQTEAMVVHVVQKVAQEVLNKSISLDDHHALMVASLEKAKKQGIFG